MIYRHHRPTFVVHFAERVAMIEGAWDPEASSATDYVWLIWIHGWVPQPPVWLRPGMQDTYTRTADMALASPGEAKRRRERKKHAERQAAEQAVSDGPPKESRCSAHAGDRHHAGHRHRSCRAALPGKATWS